MRLTIPHRKSSETNTNPDSRKRDERKGGGDTSEAIRITYNITLLDIYQLTIHLPIHPHPHTPTPSTQEEKGIRPYPKNDSIGRAFLFFLWSNTCTISYDKRKQESKTKTSKKNNEKKRNKKKKRKGRDGPAAVCF